jgi:hypothetical protein
VELVNWPGRLFLFAVFAVFATALPPQLQQPMGEHGVGALGRKRDQELANLQLGTHSFGPIPKVNECE